MGQVEDCKITAMPAAADDLVPCSVGALLHGAHGGLCKPLLGLLKHGNSRGPRGQTNPGRHDQQLWVLGRVCDAAVGQLRARSGSKSKLHCIHLEPTVTGPQESGWTWGERMLVGLGLVGSSLATRMTLWVEDVSVGSMVEASRGVKWFSLLRHN